MTTQEFQRLVDRASPSGWLRLDWGQYDTEAFAAAFLPQVNTRFPDERLRLVDAGELFAKSIVREFGRAAPTQGQQELFVMTVHTMAGGVLAEANKQKIAVASDELLARFIVRQDDTVRVEFDLGRNVQQVLQQLKKGDAVPAHMFLNSTVAELDEHARNGFDRLVVTRLLADELDLTEDLMTALEPSPVIPEAPFDAGHKRDPKTGGWAHGDIEERALDWALYSLAERRQVYYGNWLRDYSQILVGMLQGFNAEDAKTLDRIKVNYPYRPPTFSAKGRQCLLTQKQWVDLIRILAVQEFAFKATHVSGKRDIFKSYPAYLNIFEADFGALDTDKLGLYRPEEHLDNPKGLADESIYDDAALDTRRVHCFYEQPRSNGTSDLKRRTFSKGLPQTEERNDLGTGPLDIDSAALMKNFILHDIDDLRSPLTFFTEQLTLAARKGRKKDGLRHFGAALHVLEDFYAHSNFVEIALIKSGASKVWPWVQMTPAVENMTDGVAKAKLIPITTGYFSSADTMASLFTKVEEILLMTADNPFISEDDNPPLPNIPHYRTFSDVLIIHYLESKVNNSCVLKLNDKPAGVTYKWLLEFYNAKLAVRDWFAAEANSDALGGLWGWFIRGVKRNLEELGDSLAFFPQIILGVLAGIVFPLIKEAQTLSNDYGDDPSHTQLAKDDIDHPLNELAGLLALEAVKKTGAGMAEVWRKNRTIEDLIEEVKDTYFKHPSQIDWMDPHVSTWKDSYPGRVKRAEEKTQREHVEKSLEHYMQQLSGIIDSIRRFASL